MPLYEYRCLSCQAIFEALRSFTEADVPVPCPTCGREGQRLVSVFASEESGRLRTPDHDAFREDGATYLTLAAVAALRAEMERDLQRLREDLFQRQNEAEHWRQQASQASRRHEEALAQHGETERQFRARLLELEQQAADASRRHEEAVVQQDKTERQFLARVQELEQQAADASWRHEEALAQHGETERQFRARVQELEQQAADASWRHEEAVVQQRETELHLRARVQELEQQAADASRRHEEAVVQQRETERQFRARVQELEQQAADASRWHEEAVVQQRETELHLRARVQGLEQRVAAFGGVADELANLGLTRQELSAFVQRLLEVAKQHDLPPARFVPHLLGALESLGARLDAEAELAVKRQELASAAQRVRDLESESLRLRESLGVLQKEQQQRGDLLEDLMGQARRRFREGSEEAANTMRDGAQRARNELDTLLERVLGIAGKAAQVDADIRSKEWLSRFLSLVEHKDGVKPPEARVLALILLEALSEWALQHKQATPDGMADSLTRLIGEFKEWKA